MKYYFYLESYVFIWQDKRTVLVYNSLLGQSYKMNNNPSLYKLIGRLQELSNLYCIDINEDQRISDDVSTFINKIIDSSSGNILEAIPGQNKPVSLVPILNNQHDVERLRNDETRSIGENIINYIHEIDICLDAPEIKDTPINRIGSFLKSIRSAHARIVNVHGCNVLSDMELELMIEELGKITLLKVFYLSADYYVAQNSKFSFLKSEGFQLKLTVSESVDRQKLLEANDIVLTNNIGHKWSFSICSGNDYQEVMEIVEELEINNYEIWPFFNGSNLQFIEDNVYLNDQDFENPGLSKREVFAHQAINTNDFGKLTIMADGKVYANPNFPALGTIDDNVKELVYKEMDKGTSWRRVRNMKPCSSCIYQWLCPSPNDYELAIGKPNLCHIKP